MKRLIFKYDILIILMLYYFTSSPLAKKIQKQKTKHGLSFLKPKKRITNCTQKQTKEQKLQKHNKTTRG